MVRYFMTIPEASQLVLQAGVMGCSGEIYILDMGQPVRIVSLAEDLIRLSGFRPHKDIEIVYSGMRPGEKLFEEIAIDGENAQKTRHPKIFIGRGEPRPFAEIRASVDRLLAAADGGERRALIEGLRGIVPTYHTDAPSKDDAVVISLRK